MRPLLINMVQTSVAFIGVQVVRSSSQRPTVTIDDEMVFSTVKFDDPIGSIVYKQWFQSPTLLDGLLLVTVSNCSNGTIID